MTELQLLETVPSAGAGPATNDKMTAAEARGNEASSNDRPLRIVIVVETFAKDMGYVSNTLPKYLSRLGHRVDLVTSEKLPYFQKGSGNNVFGSDFAARNQNQIGRQSIDGYTVHTVPSVQTFGYSRLQGLHEKLAELAPDLVCIFVAVGWIPLDSARSARRLGFRLVIGNHTGKTHFPLFQSNSAWYSAASIKNFVLRTLPGRFFIGPVAHHCVVPTVDCADIATDFFGIARKSIQVLNLPVDTDFFRPIATTADAAERQALRSSLGFSGDATVCVYSGKFTQAKNPLVLLRAVEILAGAGHDVRALFIGAGEQMAALSGNPLGSVIPFLPFSELGRYFRAADIGVWMDESISYLDAAASGLPLVLGDTVKDISHLVEFTSVFEANNAQSLAAKILPLLDPTRRRQTGHNAAALAFERFSALRYTQRRVACFHAALTARAGATA